MFCLDSKMINVVIIWVGECSLSLIYVRVFVFIIFWLCLIKVFDRFVIFYIVLIKIYGYILLYIKYIGKINVKYKILFNYMVFIIYIYFVI